MPSLPANDLRSEAKDYQRDANHKAKWARGVAPAQGRVCTHVDLFAESACEECGVRPQHRDHDRRCGRHYVDMKHAWNRKNSAQKATLARKALRNEVDAASDAPLAAVNSDSSSEEEVNDGSTAPVPDAGVMYSFDARSGPSAGSGILSQAINKAVQRFENKETEKLVKEYDLVEDGMDADDGHVADVDDDGFELIDESHLK